MTKVETFEFEIIEVFAEQLQKELLRIGFEKVEPKTDNLKSNEVIQWEDLPKEK